MRPDQLHALATASDPRVSPDGSTIAFVVTAPDLEGDRYQREIWLAEPTVRRFTSGPDDSNPRWSPDGRRLAFLRSVNGNPAQVTVMPADGEAVTVSDFRYGAEAVEWSPDGTRLAAVGVTPIGRLEDLDDDELARRPRRFTRHPYRFDGMGWIDDRRRHIWILDPAGIQEPRCLTPGDFDETSPMWSPDGSTIAFVTDRESQPGLVAGNDVFEVDIGTRELIRAVARGFWQHASYRPDGVLHLLGNEEADFTLCSYLFRREGDGGLTNLTGHTERSSIGLGVGPYRIEWEAETALVGYEDSGTIGVVAVTPGGHVARVVGGEQVVTGFAPTPAGPAYTASRWDRPGELFLGDQQLTGLSGGEVSWVRPTHFRAAGTGGEIDTWVYLPDGEEPVPLLLCIHGGPPTQYGFDLFDEFQVYASAGYGVVACNPRGSSGRGEEWIRAVKGDGWGVVDLADIRAAVAGALERFPRLDRERMGVMGSSYGGMMTAWIIGHEDRWRSAVVESAVTEWTSFVSTSDLGGLYARHYLQVDYPDGHETWWRHSPVRVANRVTTPTLVLHSDEDWRVPIGQGEQFFMALLRNGTPTEMVRFAGESHGLSRIGTPKHRRDRFEAILDWHSRYLM